MLQIRKGQLDDIRHAQALTQFEDEMVSLFRELAPRRYRLFGEGSIRCAIRLGCITASELGFTRRGSVKLILELAFTHGSSFMKDPLYDWGDTLRASAGDPDEMARAEHLRQSIILYGDMVVGANGVALRRAIHRFHGLGFWDSLVNEPKLEEAVLTAMREVYPERWSYLGESRLRVFIGSRRNAGGGAKYVVPQVLLAESWMAYWAGSGFPDDPLFPWARPMNLDSRSSSGEEWAQTLVRFCRRYTEAVMRDWETISHNGAGHV